MTIKKLKVDKMQTQTLQIKIANVVAYMPLPRSVDFYKTSVLNPELIYDETSHVASYPTTCGNGKLILMKNGINVVGMHSEKQAKDELHKALARLKLVFIGVIE